MPTLKNKHKYIKVLRPNGTRYAEATMKIPVQSDDMKRQVIPVLVGLVAQNALNAFYMEFKGYPHFEQTVFETVITDTHMKVTVIEVPDD